MVQSPVPLRMEMNLQCLILTSNSYISGLEPQISYASDNDTGSQRLTCEEDCYVDTVQSLIQMRPV